MYTNVPGNFGGKELVLTVAGGVGGANDEIWIGPNGGAVSGHIQLVASNIHMNTSNVCLNSSCLTSSWGEVFGGSYTSATTYCAAVNNPKTGGQSCPAGYTAYLSGRGVCNTSDVAASSTYVCVKN